MTITKVVNIYKEQYDVYGGRGQGIFNNPLKCKINQKGWLGNPVAIGKECLVCKGIHLKSGETIECFSIYFNNRIITDIQFRDSLLKLKGLKLGCFCKPKPCHLDIIADYINKN